jgi:hypothetical protein
VGEDGELRATDVADRLLHHIHRPARRRPRLVPIPGGMVASPSATPPPPPTVTPPFLLCHGRSGSAALQMERKQRRGREPDVSSELHTRQLLLELLCSAKLICIAAALL